MARLVASATGIEFATVDWILRVLRTNGLTSTGAPGRHAPEQTPLDAARLMIGVLTTDRAVDAARAVEVFGKLRENGSFLFETADRITADLFEDAVAELIGKLAAATEPSKVSIVADVSELTCWIEENGQRYRFVPPALIDKGNKKPADLEPLFALRAAFKNSRVRVRREIREDAILPIAAAYRAS